VRDECEGDVIVDGRGGGIDGMENGLADAANATVEITVPEDDVLGAVLLRFNGDLRSWMGLGGDEVMLCESDGDDAAAAVANRR
jgi:hypothetical protein